MELVKLPISKIRPYPNNPRKNDGAVEAVAESIRQCEYVAPIIVDEDHVILAGHTRLKALKKLGYKEAECSVKAGLTGEQKRKYRLLDNKTNELADWDLDLLAEELDGLDLDGFDFGFDDNISSEYSKPSTPGILRDKFVVPPFSVLDARQSDWQRRKKAWISVIDSGKGRSENLLGDGLNDLGKKLSANLTGTSIFDPVLTEVLLHWFSPKGGSVLDPFAGGCVRGVVSQFLQRYYTGVDLRQEQIEENNEQFQKLHEMSDFFGEPISKPTWICGDSAEIDKLAPGKYDFMLTCPPYFDLEIYSDDPADLSNMSYGQFLETYGTIIKKSADMLSDNAFAAIVVGEVRDEKGIYRNFIGDTIKAFEKAGMKYYNEIILVTMLGTLPVRVSHSFEISRKVGNTHQKALIFCKHRDDESFEDMISTFDKTRMTAELKRSVLVFLKGDPKLAKADIERYLFDLF